MAGHHHQQGASSAPLHLLVFPWLAFGHLIPFLELSKRLAARGHFVTFVSTPRNVARLPPVPAGLSGRVRIVALPLPAVDGLPEGAESTADLPPDKVELLKAAFDGLAAPFAEIFAAACSGDGSGEQAEFGRRPDWIVLDFAHYWLCAIAEQHQVPCAMFGIFTGSALAYVGSRRENISHPRVSVDDFMPMPTWFPSPSSLSFRRQEAAWMSAGFRPNASGVSDIERVWRTEERCRLLLFRSCPEVEPLVFPLLADIYRKPVVPAGLLLPEDGRPDGGDHDDDSADIIRSGALHWLDEQPPGSVLYVALGSEAPVTVEGVHELAAGLELSEARFLWALRLPSGGGAASEATGAPSPPLLPDGFEARTRGRGAVCTGWVPQVMVLAHAAVGAFLTHCGWGSVTESLRFGHPLVMLPFITDQGLIARIMADRGVGVEVARRDDGAFSRDDVAEAVRRVMVEQEGKTLALNARRLRELVVGDDGGRQERYVDELVECFRRHSFNDSALRN
ncbi:putative UDP-rhamnose:rhamnosyltransferase 1 [Dichanthelium oligosanthes]|uniref:Glycosyltransferase n=1 Tax=Dichanthelium oligosanthes TaxID=888268 RepID=A0A1E5WMM3_9POAL|nr:putative UDP-rhamnose:rhamnosyltransferase 1 [Dichanthelium oligosanthes]